MKKLILIFILLQSSIAFAAKEDGPTLAWQEIPYATSYQIEISGDKGFNHILLQERVETNSFKWTTEKPGIFYWRVRALDAGGQLGDLSSSAVVTIIVPPPKLIDKIKTTSNENLNLQWKPVNFASLYEIQVSKDLSFINPHIFKSKTTSLRENFQNKDPLYWRVIALNDRGEVITRFSEVGVVKFQKAFPLQPQANHPAVYVEPQSDDLLFINGKRYYLEAVLTKIIKDQLKDYLIQIKVSGLQNWDLIALKGSYRCLGTDKYEELNPTEIKDIWSFEKNSCVKGISQFCLSRTNGQQACSPWLDLNKQLKVQKETQKVFNKPAIKPFWWNGAMPLYWAASDGRSMQIIWDKSFEMERVNLEERNPPNWYVSGLLSVVQFQNYDQTGALQRNFVLLGAGQAVYWPEASSQGDLGFEPKRIGAQFRYSGSIATLSQTKQSVDVSWTDVSMNYRFEPSNVFEGQHFYGILAASSYTSLGNTVDRFGGGLGFSVNYPKPFLGIDYRGKFYSYVDVLFLPMDFSGDNRGNVISSKLNGIWLFDNHWFLTGDLELRLLNFAMTTEDSVFRVQFGGGFAF